MKCYSVHFSPWHELYYVIETESGRGRTIYAHAWRMCAQFVAECHQSQLSEAGGAGTSPDIQNITAMTQPNALFPCLTTDTFQHRPFGNARRLRGRSPTFTQSVESQFAWSVFLVRRFRRRLARLLRHSLRKHSLPPGCDVPAVLESRS